MLLSPLQTPQPSQVLKPPTRVTLQPSGLSTGSLLSQRSTCLSLTSFSAFWKILYTTETTCAAFTIPLYRFFFCMAPFYCEHFLTFYLLYLSLLLFLFPPSLPPFIGSFFPSSHLLLISTYQNISSTRTGNIFSLFPQLLGIHF